MNNKVIRALKTATDVFPILRIGQIMDNAMYYKRQHADPLLKPDLFYITDDELASAILDYCAFYTTSKRKQKEDGLA